MENRIALVIGNADYAQSTPLRNPRNDAGSMSAVLRKLGFKVLSGLDLKRDAMEDKLSEFEGIISDADVAMIYYAGHGLQVNGQNYLIPIDADIRQEIHLKRRAFSLDELLQIMARRARSSLIFLDACRDNPFSRTLLSGMNSGTRSAFSVRSGLAEVRVSRGSFIAFATAPDNVANDGEGINSPFTEAVLANIETPDISVSDLMIKVRNQVLTMTQSRQEPWDQSSLRDRFCFNPSAVVDPPSEVGETKIVKPPDIESRGAESLATEVSDSNQSNKNFGSSLLAFAVIGVVASAGIYLTKRPQSDPDLNPINPDVILCMNGICPGDKKTSDIFFEKNPLPKQSETKKSETIDQTDKSTKVKQLAKTIELITLTRSSSPKYNVEQSFTVLGFSTATNILRIRYKENTKTEDDFSDEGYSQVVELPLKATYVSSDLTKSKYDDATFGFSIACRDGAASCIEYSESSGICRLAGCDKPNPKAFTIWSTGTTDISAFRQNLIKLMSAIRDS